MLDTKTKDIIKETIDDLATQNNGLLILSNDKVIEEIRKRAEVTKEVMELFMDEFVKDIIKTGIRFM